jgi:1-phosphatidylinositol phosphodiesterase
MESISAFIPPSDLILFKYYIWGFIKMLYCKNLFLIIVASLFIIGCAGDDSFDELDFDDMVPPESGESITPPDFLEGEHGDYSCVNWMNAPSFWRRNQSLAGITLPGTHNSGTSNYGPGWAPTAKCQWMNINDQLKIGVRFLDLRVGFDGKSDPQICHGKAGHANRTLNQVLLGVRNFLHRYPSECAVLCFDDEYNEGKKLTNAIERLLYSNDYKNYVYDKPVVPHLNDVRGKMIYWRRYGDKGGRGLRVSFSSWNEYKLYDNAYLHIQDKYEATGDNKFAWIIKSLDYAIKNSGEKSNRLDLCICFTSYFNEIPAPWSDGPRMNDRVKKFIVNYQKSNDNKHVYMGIIASDYVSRDYVHKVYATNFQTEY